MAKSYTTTTLIKLLYNELGIFSKLEIEDAIENDTSLAEEYNMLKASISSLPKVKFFPKVQSVENILVFSRLNSMNATC